MIKAIFTTYTGIKKSNFKKFITLIGIKDQPTDRNVIKKNTSNHLFMVSNIIYKTNKFRNCPLYLYVQLDIQLFVFIDKCHNYNLFLYHCVWYMYLQCI